MSAPAWSFSGNNQSARSEKPSLRHSRFKTRRRYESSALLVANYIGWEGGGGGRGGGGGGGDGEVKGGGGKEKGRVREGGMGDWGGRRGEVHLKGRGGNRTKVLERKRGRSIGQTEEANDAYFLRAGF